MKKSKNMLALTLVLLVSVILIAGCDDKKSSQNSNVQYALNDLAKTQEQIKSEYCSENPSNDACMREKLEQQGLPVQQAGESIQDYADRINERDDPILKGMQERAQITEEAIKYSDSSICEKLGGDDRKLCVAQTIVASNKTEDCISKLSDISYREYCLLELAKKLKDRTLCDKIKDSSKKKECNDFFIGVESMETDYYKLPDKGDGTNVPYFIQKGIGEGLIKEWGKNFEIIELDMYGNSGLLILNFNNGETYKFETFWDRVTGGGTNGWLNVQFPEDGKIFFERTVLPNANETTEQMVTLHCPTNTEPCKGIHAQFMKNTQIFHYEKE